MHGIIRPFFRYLTGIPDTVFDQIGMQLNLLKQSPETYRTTGKCYCVIAESVKLNSFCVEYVIHISD